MVSARSPVPHANACRSTSYSPGSNHPADGSLRARTTTTLVRVPKPTSSRPNLDHLPTWMSKLPSPPASPKATPSTSRSSSPAATRRSSSPVVARASSKLERSPYIRSKTNCSPTSSTSSPQHGSPPAALPAPSRLPPPSTALSLRASPSPPQERPTLAETRNLPVLEPPATPPNDGIASYFMCWTHTPQGWHSPWQLAAENVRSRVSELCSQFSEAEERALALCPEWLSSSVSSWISCCRPASKTELVVHDSMHDEEATPSPEPILAQVNVVEPPPDMEEVNRALEVLGYSLDGRVAQVVHRVFESERATSTHALTHGLSGVVAGAVKARRAVAAEQARPGKNLPPETSPRSSGRTSTTPALM